MSLTEPRVRRPWARAYNLWGVPVVAWTILLIVQVATHLFVPRWAIPVIGAPLDGVAVVLFVGRRLEKRRLAVVAACEAEEARELRTPRAPDAGPDQCPVCGGYGLDDLAADDTFMERGVGTKVVQYGRRRAHRDCAEFVPYKPTEVDRQREKIERWQREDQAAEERDRRNFEDSWPVVMAPAKRGATSIRLDREAAAEYRHWMIAIGPIAHNDILVIDSCKRARDGFGWVAHLAEPLRHTLRVDNGLTNKLMPLDSDRLWNREAGRPYTRTELGLCDCWEGPAATRPPRMPADWERLGEEFDREHGWLWPETKGWRR